MTNLTNLLTSLRQAEAAAGPGPWVQHGSELSSKDHGTKVSCYGYALNQQLSKNAEFIALSRTAIPKLLQIVEAQREALEFYAERSVYARPEDWRDAKEGGPPSFEDCEEVSGIASEALAEVEGIAGK